MGNNEPIAVSRDCEAIQIPSGEKVTLSAGTQVVVTQSLGGTYTVMTDWGSLLRIAGKDADAIGEAPVATWQKESFVELDLPEIERMVWDELRTVYDPEIPVSVVELGLVYECRITPLLTGGHKAEVKMTLTAPGCGMGEFLKVDAESKILTVPGIREADVEMVVDPPWDPSMMSDAARLELGMF